MKKVIAFGAFDPLHEGHKDFLRQAKKLGDHLTVVVAHDSAIRAHKHREPMESHEERMKKVAAVEAVDDVILGNKTAHKYELLRELDFDVLVLGYDQQPSDETVRTELIKCSKGHIPVVRLKPYHPEKYKSSLLRPAS